MPHMLTRRTRRDSANSARVIIALLATSSFKFDESSVELDEGFHAAAPRSFAETRISGIPPTLESLLAQGNKKADRLLIICSRLNL